MHILLRLPWPKDLEEATMTNTKSRWLRIKNGRDETKGYIEGFWCNAAHTYVTIPGVSQYMKLGAVRRRRDLLRERTSPDCCTELEQAKPGTSYVGRTNALEGRDIPAARHWASSRSCSTMRFLRPNLCQCEYAAAWVGGPLWMPDRYRYQSGIREGSEVRGRYSEVIDSAASDPPVHKPWRIGDRNGDECTSDRP